MTDDDTITEWQPSLENFWRSIIPFGRNVASYKFACSQLPRELWHVDLCAVAAIFSFQSQSETASSNHGGNHSDGIEFRPVLTPFDTIAIRLPSSSTIGPPEVPATIFSSASKKANG